METDIAQEKGGREIDKGTRVKMKIALVMSIVCVGIFIALSFSHHGAVAYGRMDDSTIDISTAAVYQQCSVETTDQSEKVSSPKSVSLVLDTYDKYNEFVLSIDQTSLSINKTFFSSYKLLVSSREGSYYKVSQVNKCSLSEGTMRLDYYIEDNDSITGAANESGFYTFNLFRVARSDAVSKVIVVDHWF